MICENKEFFSMSLTAFEALVRAPNIRRHCGMHTFLKLELGTLEVCSMLKIYHAVLVSTAVP